MGLSYDWGCSKLILTVKSLNRIDSQWRPKDLVYDWGCFKPLTPKFQWPDFCLFLKLNLLY